MKHGLAAISPVQYSNQCIIVLYVANETLFISH